MVAPVDARAQEPTIAVCMVGAIRSFQTPWVQQNILQNLFEANPSFKFHIFASVRLEDAPGAGLFECTAGFGLQKYEHKSIDGGAMLALDI